MLRKIRKNYKRLVAFFLSAAMIISNVGGNVGTVFAAEEQEERESAIFMVDGREILEAIQDLDGQEAFSKEDLEEMGLEAGRKGILKKYEKLLLPEKGKVYELALDINTELALEGTALQAFYNTETKEVIFLYLNESSQAVDFYVNIDGYETKLVTVEANDANAAAGQPEAEEGKEEPEKSAGGTSGGGAGGTGESANDGSKDAGETSEEGSKEAESASGETASENESSGEAAEESSKEDAPSAEQPEEKGSEDGSNGSDKASEEGSKADESKEESKEGSEAEDKGKDESEDKGQAEDGTDSVKEDGEKSDPDKKETEDSKQEDGNTDKESNDKGNAGKPNDTASDDGSSKESGEAKEESGDKADHEADGKDEEKSEEDGSKKDDADKADQADGDFEGKGNAGSEGEKTSDDKSDDGSVKEDSADKADDHGAKGEDSADKGEDRSSDEGKSDSDGADSDSGDRHERNTLSLSMSIHQAAIVAIPADEIEGEAEPEEETTAVEEKEEEPEETTTAAEVTEEETEEKTTAAEVTEEETEEKTTAAAETEETAEKETTTAAAETEETIKEETEAAQPEETTEIEKATETEAEKESEAETTVKAEEAAGETTEKAEDTSEEATEAKTEEETKPEETTTEAAKAEGSGQGASDGAGNSSQEITDDWEIPGKAYDTVTIQETINARAYCVAIEDVKKIVEANQGIEAIETILAAAKTYTAETDDAEFTVGVPEGAFAEEVELRAVKIEDEAQLKEMADQAEGALEEGKTVSGIVAYDLSFVSLVSGEEVEPAKAVSVNIRMKEPVALSQEDQEEENAADGGVSVVHLPDEGEAEVVAEAGNGQETNFAFEAESFSDFVLVRTALKAGVESGALKAAIDKAISENEGVLVLDQDYEESALITEKETSLIKIERDLTIDLNGHTITYANEGTAAGKSFLAVNKGNLIIQDNSESQEGKIISTVNDLDALIRVESSGKLTVEGGTFETSGIRAFFVVGGVINMTGGKITDSGNAGASWGAGVLVAGGGTFNMTGGEITENEGLYGGAIGISSSKANIGGQAKITNNKATSGGGIAIYGTSKLTIGKGALISGNEAISYGGGIYALNSESKESTTIVDSSIIIGGADNVGAKAEISNNTASAGGAVYGVAPCNVTIKENVIVSGNVSENGGKAIQGNGKFEGVKDNNQSSNVLLEDLTLDGADAPYMISKHVVINLNGHTITYTGNQALFQIVNGGSLTILDEATDEMPVADGETSREGRIVSGEQDLDSLVSVLTGGELTIAGGTLENKGGRAVLSEGGTVTMTGGHIKGSGVYDESGVSGLPGGGILLKENGKFEMTGGSIEGNQGKRGGGIYTNNSAVTITGDAKVSGNKAADDGGGICALGKSVVTVSGNAEISSNIAYGKTVQGHGYLNYEARYGGGGIFGDESTTIILKENCVIDSNKSEATVPETQRGGGYNGGGGIFSLGTVQMDGGTVSNNEATDAGGGIYSAGKGKFKMSGGTISGNTAKNDEGGGLRVDGKGGEITGGKILNNTTNTTFDWGGGGIFVNSGAELTIKNLLVTGNTAAGFGGGVGGCSVGNVQVFDIQGAAIYGNAASGTGLTQRANKIDDHTMKTEPIWSKFQNGYQDYYCAGVSTVHGKMLGGGDANWIGSYYKESPGKADASKQFDLNTEWGEVEICGDSSQTAGGWMALTARPSKLDKDVAEEAAIVEIRGNTSATHGGGIMSNGKLILGDDPGSRSEKGSLTISKVAEEDAFSDKDLFKFTITLKDKNDNELAGSYPFKIFLGDDETNVVRDGNLNFANGSATEMLKVGQSLKIRDLLPGTKFTVTETGANVKYETTVNGEKGEKGEGSIKGNSGSTVTFTNKPYTGNLEISKTVVSEGELTEKNKTDSFGFIITLTKKNGEPLAGEYSYTKSGAIADEEGYLKFDSGKAEITLKHRQKMTLSGIPEGTNYTVTEEHREGYDPVNGTITGEIEKGLTASASITNNVVATGSLTINKTVVGEHLTDLDKTAEFKFQVEFKDSSENLLTGEFKYTGDREGTISNNGEVTLSHGEQITFDGLPKGTLFTVWEKKTDKTDGYTAEIKKVSGVVEVADEKDGMLIGGTGEIVPSDSPVQVLFTNTVNTGKLSIQKTVTGTANANDDEFTFAVTLTGKGGQPLTGSYSYVGSSTVSGIDAPQKGELNLDEEGKGTIRLMHGQKITISGLPVGTVYQVEEMPYDGYKVILPDNTQGTIAEKDGEITVAFTNQMETGKLSIQKIVTGKKGDKTKDFHFTITLTKDGKPLTGTYPYTGIAFKEGAASPSPSQGSLTLADGQAEISLKHGQRITLSGIPAGTSYTVTEREAGQDGYTTNKTDAEGTIVNDGEKTAEFVNNKPDTPEESTTPEDSTPETTTPEETPEESTTPEETTPTETPEEPTTPEPTPSETPENPTTPSRPSGGGGRDRDRNPSVTPETTPIPPEEVPLANIDPEDVPMAMMPSESPVEAMVIDDESVPLFGLPKTGDRGVPAGALIGMMLLSLMAACGIQMNKHKDEE